MALYSVWDWDRNVWRVYATQRPVSVGDDPVAPRSSSASAIGLDPDSDVKPLPSGARFQGYSHVARGEIRRASNGLGDTGDDAGSGSSWLMFAAGAAVAGGVAWWVWRRKR